MTARRVVLRRQGWEFVAQPNGKLEIVAPSLAYQRAAAGHLGEHLTLESLPAIQLTPDEVAALGHAVGT
jgi:hypothetical protein